MKELILEAYNRGVILSGLSAGAICWFEKIYTDSEKISGGEYVVRDGLGVLKGIMTPHFNLRDEFVEVSKNYAPPAYAVEDNSALVFENEELIGALTSGGKAYTIECGIKQEVSLL
jgi:peptidase E